MPGRIDVHHHVIPPAITQTFAKRGITKVAGAEFPTWTPQTSLDVMTANGIETALLSHAAPGVYFGDKAEAITLARACNDYAAEVVAKHPGRFGFFAALPMPFTHEACAEAIRALDTLKADGVVLLGSTDGKFLGDPSFNELMAELNRRKAIVFVHPNIHDTSTKIGLNIPEFFVEFLCDTTRAATNLIFSGAAERYPDISWILSHAGGFLPFIAWRLSLGMFMPPLAQNMPQGTLTYIKRFYYDTALSPSPFAMAALKELVEPDHILFGSDFPFAPAPVIGIEVNALNDLNVFDRTTKSGIDRTHALKLFPKYA